jgi:hypothetical protein
MIRSRRRASHADPNARVRFSDYVAKLRARSRPGADPKYLDPKIAMGLPETIRAGNERQ